MAALKVDDALQAIATWQQEKAELLDVLKRFIAFPFAHQGIAEGPLAVLLQQAATAIAHAERAK